MSATSYVVGESKLPGMVMVTNYEDASAFGKRRHKQHERFVT